MKIQYKKKSAFFADKSNFTMTYLLLHFFTHIAKASIHRTYRACCKFHIFYLKETIPVYDMDFMQQNSIFM